MTCIFRMCTALKLSGSEHIAEEVTSETFFKALHSIGKFRGQCDIRVWLCQIARNCYISSSTCCRHILAANPEKCGSNMSMIAMINQIISDGTKEPVEQTASRFGSWKKMTTAIGALWRS